MKSKQLQFADLVERVQSCSLCPRMTQRTRVLGPPNGNLDSSVVFIAEAPGRLGADKFGIPLFGDQTGRNFDGPRAFIWRPKTQQAKDYEVLGHLMGEAQYAA